MSEHAKQWAARLARALFGATLLGLVASLLDAWLALGDETRLSLGAVWLTDAGLIAPLGWLVGGAVGVALVMLEPSKPRTLGSTWRDLTGAPGETAATDEVPPTRLSGVPSPIDVAPGERAARLLLLPPASVAVVVLVAQAARRALGTIEARPAAGSALALAMLGWALVLGVGALVAARALGRRVKLPASGAAAGGVLLAVALLVYGVSTGTTGGEGGLLGVLGVLKRPELDLRGPGLLLLMAIGAVLGPGLGSRVFAPLAGAIALLPIVLVLRAPGALDRSAALTRLLEAQGAPLGRTALAIARKLDDRDHDGFSRSYGGGDCNDRDARVFPTAPDEPGNGIDEDCSGADAPVPSARPVGPSGSAPSSAATPSGSGSGSAAGAPLALPSDLAVILITVDTMRADLGYAGNPRPLSPNLDKLAARSVVFEKAYSLASYTGKSVGPLLMGKYPSESHRDWSHFNTFGKADTMVAERVHGAGIPTLSVQAHWYFTKCCGLDRGFDTVDATAAPPGISVDADATISGDKLTDAAIARLGDATLTKGRFFAWVHYVDPHADYMPHPGYADFGRDERARYDGEIAFTDAQVGKLLDFIGKQPWHDRVAIVVTSDHGEAFGEHKLIRHGFEIWEELVRVPLLVSVPGVTPGKVTVRRSAIDVVPTILELLHVAPTSNGANDFVSGRSLVPDLAKPSAAEARDVFVDMPAGPNNQERRALIHGDRKLYVSAGASFQLFDLGADPGEKTDLGESDKAALAEEKSRYEAMKGSLHEVYVKPIPK